MIRLQGCRNASKYKEPKEYNQQQEQHIAESKCICGTFGCVALLQKKEKNRIVFILSRAKRKHRLDTRHDYTCIHLLANFEQFANLFDRTFKLFLFLVFFDLFFRQKFLTFTLKSIAHIEKYLYYQGMTTLKKMEKAYEPHPHHKLHGTGCLCRWT